MYVSVCAYGPYICAFEAKTANLKQLNNCISDFGCANCHLDLVIVRLQNGHWHLLYALL